MNTVTKILRRMVEADTLLCVGLDPDLRKLPRELHETYGTDESKVLYFLQKVVDATVDLVCAYKVQKAFFDALPGGHELLVSIIDYVHQANPQVSVIVDAKIGDIDNTMEAYADNILGHMGADGIVINPYMGTDVIDAFDGYAEKAVIVLAKTSNPGGAVVQDVELLNGLRLWEHILHQITGPWNKHGNMIPVLAATAGLDMRMYRSQIPDQMPILLAGVGAQGGSTEDLRGLLNTDNVGVFVNSSRGILYPPQNATLSWEEAIAFAAFDLKKVLNGARSE